jgi:hypothetical protein
MINTVRNAVLTILSKDNRGYVTPEEFNLMAKQAQVDIFEQYFYDFSTGVVKRNARIFNTGHANVPEKIEAVIDTFIVPDEPLQYNGTTDTFFLPGTNPANPTQPTLYKTTNLLYNNNVEVEKVNYTKLNSLLISNFMAPNVSRPIYSLKNDGIKVYPDIIVDNMTINYIRNPRDPKWTYAVLANGEPLFNQSASDYQDFELPESDFVKIVTKILQYAGLSIRENDVVQLVNQEELQDIQQKQ